MRKNYYSLPELEVFSQKLNGMIEAGQVILFDMDSGSQIDFSGSSYFADSEQANVITNGNNIQINISLKGLNNG